MTDLWEVTITTGQAGRSQKSAVADDMLQDYAAILTDAVRSGARIQLPPDPVTQISLEATAAGPHLIATIWDDRADAPLITIAVATSSRGAGKLWASVHNLNGGSSGDIPTAPWSATVVLPSAHMRLDAIIHLGGLGTAIAWAWLAIQDARQ